MRRFLKKISVKDIKYDTDLWKTLATNTPNLTNLEVRIELKSYIPLIQNGLSLWQNLESLSIVIGGTQYGKEKDELLSGVLLSLGKNLPETVKVFELIIFHQLPSEIFTSFLSVCSARIESFFFRINGITDEHINALLKYMGCSLKSIRLFGDGYVSPDTRSRLINQVPYVSFTMSWYQ